MSPWEVIQEALDHKKPRRNLQWLADQIGASIQVVVNWKTRGVPAKRYRDVASALGITIDQLEGVERLPWDRPAETGGLSVEVAQLAAAIDGLPQKQRDWVLLNMREAVKLARETITENAVTTEVQPRRQVANSSSAKRRKAA